MRGTVAHLWRVCIRGKDLPNGHTQLLVLVDLHSVGGRVEDRGVEIALHGHRQDAGVGP